MLLLALVAMVGLVQAVGTTTAAWTNDARAAASSSGIMSGEEFQARGPGDKCLDIESRQNANNTSIRLYSCNNTPAQKWWLTTAGRIEAFREDPGDNGVTGVRCMQTSGNTNGATVYLMACPGNMTGNFRWRFVANADGTVQIRNQQGTNPATGDRCLSWQTPPPGTDPTPLTMRACGASGYGSSWRIEPYGTPPFP
ncbi:RICIN domain-containing protein [Cellulomonas terrae]|uniref:Ricin B lectin domain-containing protein n=1 Tax=Cellulomonas terrae TaxID=311234 RepID=A0A511JNG4_9CELL|nr:RICIN domain-containing protein [Cellulomonas terrae]GEL99526.1 hypothetical protein CTE05_30730 [Cellulomonas terrae]